MQSYMMGRVKLKIKKLENTNGRQATYAKRKHGIMKKANELSILCDIDIILLMFSPTGKPSLCNGKRSSIEEVMAKFAQLTPQERAKRKLESLERILYFPNCFEQDLTNQTKLLQTQISEIHRRLSYWTNLEKINNIEHLGQMENSIRESLNQIRLHKENLGKQQLLSLECTGQFQNALHLPFRLGSEQQLQPLSWIPNNDNRHMVLPEDPNLFSHRDVECSASSSFGSYSGYFGTNKSSEISNSGQESSLLSELSGTASLRLQLGGQCSYLPYNVNLLNDKFQPVGEMSIQENPVDYHVSGSLEAPRTGYDTHGSWASTSGPCEVSLFDGRLYSQQLN
ncbi:agamous-like MADS-box protein AGL30 isoform X4 [Mangifera indica]|uniref:agamous-like MADS-box protein AGL30 isoform X4 n=1 Tax=Mangifera indica TaxID=29780 RepID=UPI001CFA01BF|nr:agamous-like MADS-box protein AGL30 isoform X4 [Mangifera indica]